jgi:hypothetical protein
MTAVNKSKTYRNTTRSNLNRMKGLYENNNVALNNYEDTKERLVNSNATYISDKQNADLEKKTLGYYKLSATMSGIISGLSVEAGENISIGEVALSI